MDLIWGRYSPLAYSAIGSVVLIPLVINFHFLSPVLVITIIFTAIGIFDFFQKSSLLRANFPIIGHMRYLLESFRPSYANIFGKMIMTNSPTHEIKGLWSTNAQSLF